MVGVAGSVLWTFSSAFSSARQAIDKNWCRLKLSCLEKEIPQLHTTRSALCMRPCLDRLLWNLYDLPQVLQMKSIVEIHKT